eukprot:176673_1
MRVPNTIHSPTKASTRQEVFVSVSIVIFCFLWIPLCIEKYDEPQMNGGLLMLTFSFLSSITGCVLFLISIFCNIPGYQKASPLCLVIAIIVGTIGQFIFDHQYCHTFFFSYYSSCFIAELLSFTIYILTNYYMMSMVLSRTNFQLGPLELEELKQLFGAKMRIRILLAINVSMLIVIFNHMHIYSYFNALHGEVNGLDVVWVALCTILVTVSVVIRFPQCLPIITHQWLLRILAVIALVAYCIGCVVQWRYRINNADGMARIGNVFIWCVVNLWVLVEFMTKDLNKMMHEALKPSMAKQNSEEYIEQETR